MIWPTGFLPLPTSPTVRNSYLSIVSFSSSTGGWGGAVAIDCAVVVVVTIDPTKNKVAKETNAAVDDEEVENFMVIV